MCLQPLTRAWTKRANTKTSFSFNPGTFRASNVSHTVVLRPLKAGYFNFTSASVSYVAQEGGEVVVSLLKEPLMPMKTRELSCWLRL